MYYHAPPWKGEAAASRKGLGGIMKRKIRTVKNQNGSILVFSGYGKIQKNVMQFERKATDLKHY
jgi:hypothetical protein